MALGHGVAPHASGRFDANELRIVALAHAHLPERMTFDPADYAPPPPGDRWSGNDDDKGPSVSIDDVVSFVDSLVWTKPPP